MSFDKRHLAHHFGQAAESYDRAAHVQYQAGIQLIEQLQNLQKKGDLPPSISALDLGCGTGLLMPNLIEACAVQRLLALDISQAMIAYAKAALAQRDDVLLEKVQFICADIEALPLNHQALFSLLFCNFSLQWCNSEGVALQTLRHFVEPGGCIAMAVPGLGTFSEIKKAWGAVDGALHVNQFLAFEQWRQALVDAGFEVRWERSECISEFYPTAQAALRAIKRSGATNANRDRPRHLLGVRRYKQFLQAYADLSDDRQQFPLSYETYFFIAQAV